MTLDLALKLLALPKDLGIDPGEFRCLGGGVNWMESACGPGGCRWL